MTPVRPLAALSFVLLAAPAAFAETATLAPHRAIYDLSLLRSSESRGVDSARGRIVFEINGSSCEGFASSFRQVVQMDSSEGGPRLLDVRSSSFEEAGGKGYRFQIDRTLNQAPQSVTEGRTRAAGEGLAVEITKPKTDRVELPQGVVFPSFHTRALIEAALAAKTTLEAKTYDGSDDGQAIYDTFAVIGSALPPGGDALEEPARNAALADLRRWPVTISYYKAGAGDRTPVYVMSMELYENGVSRNLKLDYGMMALKGEMARLDFSKPSPRCE
jgi:hypothetical protein